MEHGVQADDVEIGRRNGCEIVCVANLEFEIGARFGLGQRDAQRQGIKSQHRAGRTNQISDMLGQQTSAAADIEDALARRDGEIRTKAFPDWNWRSALTRS